MDFNLEGDFGKLSSFKLDMPDLDFSSPSDKAAKPKAKAGEESSCQKRQGKKDSFSFSFDFNDLDDFDFDSSLTKGGKSSMKNLESKEVSSDGNASQGPKTKLAGDTDQLDDGKADKLPVSERVMTLVVESAVAAGTDKSSYEKFPSNSETYKDQVRPSESKPSEETRSARVEESQSFSFGEEIPARSNSWQKTQSLPVQSSGVVHSTKETVLHAVEVPGCPGGKVNAESSVELNDNERTLTAVGSDNENSELMDSASALITESEGNRSESERTGAEFLTENMLTEPVVAGEATSVASISKTMSLESKTNTDTLNSNSEVIVPFSEPEIHAGVLGKESGDFNVKAYEQSSETGSQLHQPPAIGVEFYVGLSITNAPFSASCSEPVLDKLAPVKENESGVVFSKTCRKSEETGTQFLQPSATAHVSSFGSNGISDMDLSGTEHVVDKVATRKEKESVIIRSEHCRRSEEPEPQLSQPSSGVEISSIGSRGIASMHLSHPENMKKEGINAVAAQIGRKLVGDSTSLPRELTEGQPTPLGSFKNVRTLCNIRESLKVDDIQRGAKLAVNPRPPDNEPSKGHPASLGRRTEIKSLNKSGENLKAEDIEKGRMLAVKARPPENEAARGELAPLGRGTSNKNLNNFGRGVDPVSSNDKPMKFKTKDSINSSAVLSSVGSTQNSKIMFEGLKAGKRASDLSCLKISRNMVASKDQSNATSRIETHSLINTVKSPDIQANKAKAEHVHPVSIAGRKTPVITSLKRKTFEVSTTDILHPNRHKRLSLSPIESGAFKEPLANIKEAFNHEHQPESRTKNVLFDHPTSGLEIPQEASMKDLEIPFITENDGNVEKAEAYIKELEDGIS
ncbi:hypothetical protein Tsubulata_011866, partial [Turnera subulata]